MHTSAYSKGGLVLMLFLSLYATTLAQSNSTPVVAQYPENLALLEGYIDLDGGTNPFDDINPDQPFTGAKTSLKNVQLMEERVERVAELRGGLFQYLSVVAKKRVLNVATLMQDVRGISLRGYDLTPLMKQNLPNLLTAMLSDLEKEGWKLQKLNGNGQPIKMMATKGNSTKTLGQLFVYQVLSENILDATGKVIGKTADLIVMVNVVGSVNKQHLSLIGQAYNIEELQKASF